MQGIPANEPQLSPYITVHDGAAAIAFYCKVFDGKETVRMGLAGKVGHAEIQIGRGRIMLSDEFPEMATLGPKSIGGSPVALQLYVEDVDAVFARALAAGATMTRAVENQFYGDRGGKFTDPFGHVWWIASRIENVSPEEQKRRAKELYGE